MILLRPAGPAPVALLPGSFNPLHPGHVALATVAARRLGGPVHFELTAANVDKPDLPAADVSRRVGQFAGVGPVWVTRAATFVEKARLLPGVGFVVGFDTAVRVIDPKYYGDVGRRDAALAELAAAGARFLVGGRVDAGGAFREWADEFAGLFTVIPEAEFRVDVSSTQLRGERPGTLPPRPGANRMAVRGVLVVCTLAAVASATAAGDPGWESNLSAALAKARQTGKPVLVDVYADWCGPCKKLAVSFRDPQVAAALSRGFVAVKIDADADQATARKYKVTGLPTLLVLSADGKELARTSGSQSPGDLLGWLNKVGAKPPPAGNDVGRQLDAIYAELTAKLK